MNFSPIARYFPAGASPLLAMALLLAGAIPGAEASDFKVDTGFGLLAQAGGATEAPAPEAPREEKEQQVTEITASQETSFDEKTRVVVFVGDVRVRDTQFNLSCDKLTAHLARTSLNADGEEEGGGLDRAIAEGSVIIVQEKKNEKGEVTRYVGKAKRAEYVAATGEITLTGWPQIQQGINNQVATEEGTVMILNRNGRLKTIGGSKTVIKDSSETSPTPRRTR